MSPWPSYCPLQMPQDSSQTPPGECFQVKAKAKGVQCPWAQADPTQMSLRRIHLTGPSCMVQPASGGKDCWLGPRRPGPQLPHRRAYPPCPAVCGSCSVEGGWASCCLNREGQQRESAPLPVSLRGPCWSPQGGGWQQGPCMQQSPCMQ